jgi:predicted HicB family RNase H-like nuclease
MNKTNYITVKIEEKLHNKLKAIGATSGLSLQAFVNETLRKWIEDNIEKSIKNFEREIKK